MLVGILEHQEYDTGYFKLPFIDHYSRITEVKLRLLLKRLCKTDLNIKLVFTSFKIKNMFSFKDHCSSYRLEVIEKHRVNSYSFVILASHVCCPHDALGYLYSLLNLSCLVNSFDRILSFRKMKKNFRQF